MTRTSLLARLRSGLLITPCAHDALSARLIHQAGYDGLFVSGYGVAASRALPDANLLSFAEVLTSTRDICAAVNHGLPGYPPTQRPIPVLCDGDTGYGNEMNIRRTVHEFYRAGASAIMIEDQVAPKRCGHASGKSVVARDEAVSRIKAACDARDEVCDKEIAIIARTDARGVLGLPEALARVQAFEQAGADITFLEAPLSTDELRQVCGATCTFKMANMLLGGKTPELSPCELEAMGFSIAAYPFDLLVPAIAAMRSALEHLKAARHRPTPAQIADLWEITRFNDYLREEKRYK